MCKCLTARVLKWLIYLSCFMLLGIGSVLVWIGFLIQSSEFVQLLEYSYAGFIVIACGGILIFIAFIGIVGAWKLRRFFLTLFIIASIIIGILLITFGGVLIYLRDKSSDYLESSDSCRKHFENADDTSIMSSEILCKLYCPCELDDSVAQKLPIENFYKGSATNVKECNPCESIQTYEPTVQAELIAWIDQVLGIKVNVSDCAITADEFKLAYYGTKYKKYLSLIEWMESKFECSGICTQQKIQFLNNVADAIPDKSCYSDLRKWAKKMFLNYGIISLVLGFYQLSIIYFEFALCLCPKKRMDLPPEALNSPSKAFKE